MERTPPSVKWWAISLPVAVPDGFATTADTYRRFLDQTDLAQVINAALPGLDTDDVQELATVGKQLRSAVVAQPFPTELDADIRSAYQQLSGGDADRSFAVRSSATAEDLPGL